MLDLTRSHPGDILRHAYALARSNAGAPGVDGVTFADIDLSGRETWLAGLREKLGPPLKNEARAKSGSISGENRLGHRSQAYSPASKSAYIRTFA